MLKLWKDMLKIPGESNLKAYPLSIAPCYAGDSGVQGADQVLDLEVKGPEISHEARKRFPHLSGCTSLTLPASADLKVCWQE